METHYQIGAQNRISNSSMPTYYLYPEWAVHGYPEKKGDGWVGDCRTWGLDVGALSSRLYFYQVIILFSLT